MSRPVNVAILLNYLLAGSESPKNLYFCMFVEELVNSNEKKETLARWSYEIYSTFLMSNAVRTLTLPERNFGCSLDSVKSVIKFFKKNTFRQGSEYIEELQWLIDPQKAKGVQSLSWGRNKKKIKVRVLPISKLWTSPILLGVWMRKSYRYFHSF